MSSVPDPIFIESLGAAIIVVGMSLGYRVAFGTACEECEEAGLTNDTIDQQMKELKKWR